MNNIVVNDNIKIENMIYEIRDKKVILDSDLARLYGVETKRINEAVKNNIEKFPERYCFKLSDNESNNLLAEIFDQKIEKRGGKYKNPRVFTEQGCIYACYYFKEQASNFYNNCYNGCIRSNEKYNKYFANRTKIF